MTYGNRMLMACVALGCAGGRVHPTDVLGCEVDSSTAVEEASWSGPTEDAVLSAIAAALPTSIQWEGTQWYGTLVEAQVSVVLAVRRGAGPTTVDERTLGGAVPDRDQPGCRPGPELVVPVVFSFDIASGEATGEVSGDIAVGPEGDVLYPAARGPVELGPAWLPLAEDHWDGASPWMPGTTPTYTLVLSGWPESELVWPSAGVAIEADGDDSAGNHVGMVLWRGHWEAPEPVLGVP